MVATSGAVVGNSCCIPKDRHLLMTDRGPNLRGEARIHHPVDVPGLASSKLTARHELSVV